jgi:multidrug resistance efflux pump
VATDQPIPTPARQRVQDFKTRGLPALVWTLAAVACLALMWTRTRSFEYIGIARANEYEVSANQTGTIDAVTVALFEEIEAGAIVARLDNGPLLAQLEIARATVSQLRAELDARGVTAGAEEALLVDRLRRFQVDEESRRLDILRQRVDIETDAVERDRLTLEVERNRPLVEDGFVSVADFDNLRLTLDTVQERIERNTVLLSQTEAQHAVAATRRRDFQRRMPNLPEDESLLRPLQQAVEVAMREVDEIEIRRGSLVLRSPVSGQISELIAARGQAIVAGEPVVIVAERRPSEIVAWLDDNDPTEPRDSGRVRVASVRDREHAAESLVLRIGPTFQPKPQRLWRDPRFPDYGRAIVIAGVPALDLVPGELVSVRFLD